MRERPVHGSATRPRRKPGTPATRAASSPQRSVRTAGRQQGARYSGAARRVRRAADRRDPRRISARRLRRPAGIGDYQRGAQQRLRRFRQGSLLAVSLTALLLLVGGVEPEAAAQDGGGEVPPPMVPEDVGTPAEATSQALQTLWELALGFYGMLPKLLIAALLIALAEFAGRTVRRVLRGTLGDWERTEAIIALTRIGAYLAALAVGLSIIAGDARALVGSVGLVGLALSWALQTPIESFTGWLLNSFRGYYRVGDRIEVGEVFGDVYRIDVLTTTVWEAGGPGKPVAGAQPTGALITFPNWEVLRSNLVNYSRDFPYVWDEVTLPVANESDLAYTMNVLQQAAARVLGEEMQAAAAQYDDLLTKAGLAFDIAEEPQVFISLADAWTDCTVRYLVHARRRRRWSTRLLVELTAEVAKPIHQGKIIAGYPRTEVKLTRTWDPADFDVAAKESPPDRPDADSQK